MSFCMCWTWIEDVLLKRSFLIMVAHPEVTEFRSSSKDPVWSTMDMTLVGPSFGWFSMVHAPQ